MLCSVCDGDIGTGKRKGLCPNMCDQWYQACKSDYLCDSREDKTLMVKGSLDFCTNFEVDDGQQLQTIMSDASSGQFCFRMGFNVG